MEQGFDLANIWSMVRRRWLIAVVPALLLGVLSTAIAMSLPATYSSTARILVESQQIPEELAQSTVTATAIERVRLIEQRMMTRANLLEIAENYNVFNDMRRMSPSGIVARMRDATVIQNVALATRGRGNVTASAIDISFSGRQPNITAQVANELVTRLLEQNVRERSALAAGTVEFFQNEVERLAARLGAAENELTAYKRQNEDALPTSLEFRRAELAQLENAVFEREARRLALEERLDVLEDELARARSGEQIVREDATPEERELAALRRQLLQQRALLAETHPTIRNLNARIEALEDVVTPVSETENTNGAETRQDRIVSEIERQMTVIRTQIDLIEDQAQFEERRIEALRESMERTPQVEITLGAMEREIDSLRAQYSQAVAKRAEAETGERLEVNRRAERFEVIEPAQVPSSPDSPNRPLIAAAGFGVGGLIGVMLMVAIEFLNRRVRSARDLEAAIGIRPLASIPTITTPRELFLRRARNRTLLLFVLIGVPAALFAVDTYVTPLQVLANRMVERTGLDVLLNFFLNR